MYNFISNTTNSLEMLDYGISQAKSNVLHILYFFLRFQWVKKKHSRDLPNLFHNVTHTSPQKEKKHPT